MTCSGATRERRSGCTFSFDLKATRHCSSSPLSVTPIWTLRTSSEHSSPNLRISDQLTEIALTPLNAEHTAELASLVAERRLSSIEALAVYEQTLGWPLFVVETIRAAATIAPGQPAPPTSNAVAGGTRRLPPKVMRLSRAGSRVCHTERANSQNGAQPMVEPSALISCEELFRARKKTLPSASMSFGGGASFGNAGQRHSILLTISFVKLLTRASARPGDYIFTGAWPKRSSPTEKAPRQRRPIISTEREMSPRRSANIASRAKRRFVCAPIDAPYICSSEPSSSWANPDPVPNAKPPTLSPLNTWRGCGRSRRLWRPEGHAAL